jgi:epoxyqueuosine reductase
METNLFEEELRIEIKKQGIDFLHFVDMSHLPKEQNKAYPTAILFGILLSKEYLLKVARTPNFVEQMKIN